MRELQKVEQYHAEFDTDCTHALSNYAHYYRTASAFGLDDTMRGDDNFKPATPLNDITSDLAGPLQSILPMFTQFFNVSDNGGGIVSLLQLGGVINGLKSLTTGAGDINWHSIVDNLLGGGESCAVTCAHTPLRHDIDQFGYGHYATQRRRAGIPRFGGTTIPEWWW